MKRYYAIIFVSILAVTCTFSQVRTDKQYTKYVRCAVKNNTAKALVYMNKGYNINARDVDGKTPLLYCLQTNKVSFARFLMERGADIKATDSHGNTSLHYAIENCKNSDIINLLMERGIDINAGNRGSYTPFHYSILYSCDIGLPFKMIEKGADFTRITSENENSLHLSLEAGCDTLSKFLIQQGLDINLIDAKGDNPLNKAAAAGRTAMAAKLISLGADINLKNKEGNTSIYYAISSNDNALVGLLLENNVNLQQSEKEKPYLYLAAEHENAIIVESLLNKGLQNPMLCDIHESCYSTAFVYSVNARLVPDNQKLGYFQNSLNIYKVAKEKYQNELNKIRAKNSAKFCGEVCLVAASTAATGYYYYGDYGVDYEAGRRLYLNERIDKCNSRIASLEKTITCINSAQGQQSILNCY
ncbi:MAG: ankyrin repeat domain-containing protein [Bacteroidales bacterium]|nr:ankyrin repeat domain-containing protein [Bacteroidales bacterium]